MKFKILFPTLLLLFSCAKEKALISPLLSYIPQNTSIVIRINDDAAFKSELKNNGFIKKLSKTEVYQNLWEKVKGLEHIESKSECLLAFVEEGKGNFELLYITKYAVNLLQLERVTEKTVETLTYEDRSITKYTVEGVIFFGTQIDDNLIISSSQMVLENLIRNTGKLQPSPKLEKMLAVANKSQSANLIIDAKNSAALLETILKTDQEINLSGLTDFVALDLNAGQEHLHLSGINLANDSIKSLVNIFKNSGTLNNRTPLFAPINADAILSYTFKEYSTFAKNQQRYLDKSVVMDTLFNTVEEIGYIYLNSNKAIVLNTFGSESISNFLDGIKLNSTEYQGNEIISLSETQFLKAYFNPLIQDFDANFYTILENAFVFANTMETLQMIISNYKSGTTFDKTPAYDTAMELLADESNVLFVATSSGVEQLLTEGFLETFVGDLKKVDLTQYAFAAQMVADDGFFHTNLVIQRMEKENKNNTTSPLFSIQLDAEIATDPQFVTNHQTGKKEIVVQDQENNLYLISTDGKVLWKKNLQSRIQGPIQQVDIYKNGRLQLAFTTDNQFLIIDRNGEEVKPFNQIYEGGNLNPLAVFDYDGKKEYRFVVVQNNKVFMYDNSANVVKGFTYTTAGNPILDRPKHIRSGKRDYLVLKEETGDLKILDRVGNTRIKINEKIDFSENEVYFYNDKFTLTDAKGVLYQIDESGKITKTNLNLNIDHGMDASLKTLVVMNDNVLKIKDKEQSLELGLYTPPKIFILNDKLYVTVTDTQNQKVYLFDSNADPIPNFPVFGNSVIDMADIDKDGKLELVVKDLDNSLLVYKMY